MGQKQTFQEPPAERAQNLRTAWRLVRSDGFAALVNIVASRSPARADARTWQARIPAVGLERQGYRQLAPKRRGSALLVAGFLGRVLRCDDHCLDRINHGEIEERAAVAAAIGPDQQPVACLGRNAGQSNQRIQAVRRGQLQLFAGAANDELSAVELHAEQGVI